LDTIASHAGANVEPDDDAPSSGSFAQPELVTASFSVPLLARELEKDESLDQPLSDLLVCTLEKLPDDIPPPTA